MFGGSALGAFSTYGDMWRYSPDPDCAICNTTQVVEEVSVDPSLVVLQNPVQDGMLSVRMPVGTWELEVFDMVGRSMYVLKQSCGKAVLDVGYLRNGIYLLVARGSSTAISAKFMVVH